MRKRKFYMTAAALLLLLCSACGNKQAARGEGDELLPVEVARPIVREITLTKEYPGYLESDASVTLVSRVNGTLQQIAYEAGDAVKKGDLLFVIEPTLYQDAVKQAEAQLKTAEAELDYARNNFERMKEAIKSDAVSRIQYLQSESNMAQAEASVNNAQAALRTARTNLGYCYVHAPFDGEVSRSLYGVGNYLSGAGNPVTLATLYRYDFMYCYFNIADNHWLAREMADTLKRSNGEYRVQVRLGQGGDRRMWPAKIDYVAPNVETGTGTLELRAVVRNQGHLLKSGEYVQITLPYGSYPGAVLVPDASLGSDQLGKYLYVVNDSGRVSYRHIETGQVIDDTLRWVKSGLAPGERYVTAALLKVHNGMLVRPVERTQPNERKE